MRLLHPESKHVGRELGGGGDDDVDADVVDENDGDSPQVCIIGS